MRRALALALLLLALPAVAFSQPEMSGGGGGGGGTPGGAAGTIQYNNAGALGGIPNTSADTLGNITLSPPNGVGILIQTTNGQVPPPLYFQIAANNYAGFTQSTGAPGELCVFTNVAGAGTAPLCFHERGISAASRSGNGVGGFYFKPDDATRFTEAVGHITTSTVGFFADTSGSGTQPVKVRFYGLGGTWPASFPSANTEFLTVTTGTTYSINTVKEGTGTVRPVCIGTASPGQWCIAATGALTGTASSIAQPYVATSNCGASSTVDFSTGVKQQRTLNAATCAITISNVPNGCIGCTLRLIQDATGGRLATWTGITWKDGVAPTLTPTATNYDIISIDANATSVAGIWVTNFAP